MAKYRDRLPDDFRGLLELCREGKLFAVQKWIDSGRPFRLPAGNFATSPLLVSLDKGFHSMVEVLLKAGVNQSELNHALVRSVRRSRHDLVDLLGTFGADPKVVSFEDVLDSANPDLIRWFIDHGMNMEDGNPIAYAFLHRHRWFLGIYLSIRDHIPSAKIQVTMALRVHSREGNLKWVSLLLWAGADPRLSVPDIEKKHPEDYAGTALEDAISYSQIEVIRKFAPNSEMDDLSLLLTETGYSPKPDVVRMLLEAGADPNRANPQGDPMSHLMSAFAWSFEPLLTRTNTEAVVQCIELAASFGGRWTPTELCDLNSVRRALSKGPQYAVISALGRLLKCGAIEQSVFAELMKTPKMKDILNSKLPGSVSLRQIVGHEFESKSKKRRPSRRKSQ